MQEYSSIVPLRPGLNFAPLDPLLKLGQKDDKSHYLCDALKERYKHFWNLESSTWREMASVGEMNGHFLIGDQLLERDPFSGGWLVIRPQRQEMASQRAVNYTQYFTTNCLVKLMQSNPNIIAKAAKDDDRSVSAAKAADIITDHYESEFFKAWFVLQEGLQSLTFGTYIDRLRYDAGIKGAVGLREITENRSIKVGQGAGYCGECEKVGPAAEFNPQIEGEDLGLATPMCPGCGSDAVLVEPPATEEMPTIVGTEEVQLGEFCLDMLSLLSCRFDLRTRPEWSDWFIYQQQVAVGAIRRILGPVKLPGDQGEAAQDISESVMRGLAYSGQPLSGSSGIPWRQSFGKTDQARLVEMWLSPDQYADIKLQGDERTVSGQPLPKGVSLEQLFPEGLVAVGVNGFAITLGVYAEKHRDRIASGVWHMKPMSGAGRGMADVVEVQRRYNKLDSQTLNLWDAAGSPGILHEESLFGSNDTGYLGNPRSCTPVNLSQLPEGHKLADAVMQLPPASVPAQMLQYTQQFLMSAFSTTSHVTDFTNGGITGERNDTARAAMIADANANSVFGPILAIRAGVRQRIAEMLVPEYRQYFPIQRYFSLGGASSQQAGVWLSAANLDGDIKFEIAEESELPQNSISRQDRFINFFTMFGGFAGYQQALMTNPELVAELSKLWNVTTSSSGFDTNAQLCRRRIEQMKQGMQMLQGMGAQMQGMPGNQQMMQAFAPQMLLEFIQPPISPFERAHMEKAGFYQAWLDQDEGLDMPIEFRMAVELLIQEHFGFAGMQNMALAAQQGQVAAVGAMNGPQPEPSQEKKGFPPKKEAKAA